MSTKSTASRAQSAFTATFFVAVFVAALILVLGLRPWGFVHHDTSELVMWANSGLVAGFWKHPPFLPWLVRVWSWVMPTGAFGLAMLTAVNITACAFAVWRLAQLSGAPDEVRTNNGIVAVLLLAAIPYATFMAIKLNHNAILISLWPLTILAFLRALERPNILRGAIFGLAAAAAVLAKYYSLLLLAGCLAASVAQLERAARFYRGPAPYVAVIVFAAAMLPHILWMLNQPASPLGYAFNGGAAATATPAVGDLLRRGPLAALLFLGEAPLVILPMGPACSASRPLRAPWKGHPEIPSIRARDCHPYGGPMAADGCRLDSLQPACAGSMGNAGFRGTPCRHRSPRWRREAGNIATDGIWDRSDPACSRASRADRGAVCHQQGYRRRFRSQIGNCRRGDTGMA